MPHDVRMEAGGHAHLAGRAARGGATVGRPSARGACGAAAGAVALPTMAGRTNCGAFGRAVCSTWATVKPAARMESSVGRLQSQHTTSRFSQFSRSCRRAGARVVGPDVLDEQQAAAGAQHPAQLPQRPGLIVDTAQDQRGHGHVEAVVVEGQVLGRRAQDRGVRAVRADGALQAAQHRGLRAR